MKTTTLTDDFDAPTITLLEGHHDIITFNKAFEAEGWDSQGPWPEDYLSHEYWVRDNEGFWSSSNKNNPDAIPVSIVAWDGPKEQSVDLSPHRVLH